MKELLVDAILKMGFHRSTKGSIINTCGGEGKVNLARLLVGSLIPTNQATFRKNIGQNPKTTDGCNELVGWEIFLEGQQSGRDFTNLGSMAEWPGGEDS